MLIRLFLNTFLVLFTTFSSAQCTLGTAYFNGYDAATLIEGTHTEIACCLWGNEYIPVTNMVAGNTYTFDICGVFYDSEITLFDPNNIPVAFDTDSCGDDGIISNFTPATTGTYKLQVNGPNCAGHANNTPVYLTLDTVLSIDKSNLDDGVIKIFPNPVSTSFRTNTKQTITNITIYNTVGEIVKTFGSKLLDYQISELKPGIYFAKITSNNSIAIKQLLKK